MRLYLLHDDLAHFVYQKYLNATLALSAIVDFSVTFALTYYFTVKSRSAHTR